jgi:transcriptional regulator with XRE-family HTH domain
MIRIAQRLTLVRVGTMVRCSASTLSRIETGQRKLTDVAELRLFANVLGIPPHLFGLSSAPIPVTDGAALPPSAPVPITVGETSREGGDEAMRRRQVLAGLVAVTGPVLLGPAARPTSVPAPLDQHMAPLLTAGQTRVIQPLGVPVLRQRLAAARATYQACRYHDLAVTLPDVIAATQASLAEATDQRREQAAALLAALLADGHYDTAITLLTSTALDLGADSGDPAPNLLAAYGSLLCTASYTAAQNGHRLQAVKLINEAEAAAARLSDVQSPGNPFSVTNVAIYQIGVHTALGDAGTALDYARKIELRSVPTPERQARFWVDTARAWHRFGNTHNSFQALQAANRSAPEEVRRPSVRSLLTTLLDAPGPTPSGLRDFATRCGAVA